MDKSIVCKDCGSTFVFSEQEQAFFREKGFENEPQRCPTCRAAKKAMRNGGSSSAGYAQREMYPAVCAECGRDTMVPFKPNNEKPVYCRDCFQPRHR